MQVQSSETAAFNSLESPGPSQALGTLLGTPIS